MLTQETLEKLRRMRLGAMADALQAQQRAPEIHELSFEERLGLLVDREWTARRDRRLARLLKEARLRLLAAPEDIDYRTPRGLDKPLLRMLLGGDWLRDGRNILLTGSTGVGKTFIACALEVPHPLLPGPPASGGPGVGQGRRLLPEVPRSPQPGGPPHPGQLGPRVPHDARGRC